MAVCKVRPLAEALTDATVYVLYACILRTFFHVYIICMHYDRITDAKKRRPKITCVFKHGWKPSQKTRLDVLIIFHVE